MRPCRVATFISAAGALAAALLLAAQAPAGAQTAPDQSSRDSMDVPQGSTSPRRAGGTGRLRINRRPVGMRREDGEQPSFPNRLAAWAMRPRPPAAPPLGGLGDEPNEAALQPEEAGAPVEDTRAWLGLAPPPSGTIRARPDPHRAPARAARPRPLSADRHQARKLLVVSGVGSRRRSRPTTCWTRKFDAHPDMGPELKPRLRLDSDWGRHSLSFEANADRIWYSDFPIADTKNYQLLAGASRRHVEHASVGRDRKVARPRKPELDQHHRYFQRQHRGARAARHRRCSSTPSTG